MKTSAIQIRPAAVIILNLVTLWCIAQPSSWQPRGVGGGGALFYPSINPANDNEFYVACDMSQLFHSTDFGATYTQLPFTSLQVGNVTTYEFTSNNNIAYSIANDGNINYGVRTSNGGNTWTSLPGNPLNGEDVYALKADYAIPGRIVMGYYNSLYISQDGGNNFSLIKNAADAGAGITIAGIFFDNANIYIGTNEGILFSSNGGASFAFITTSGMPAAETIFSFAGARVGGATRFFCISANAADVYNGIYPWEYWGLAKGVYSLDAGTNIWNARMTGISIANDFAMYVGMARNDINTVYIGGSDGTTGGNLVMKTSNAGGNWSKVLLTGNNQNIRTGWAGHQGDRQWSYGESCFGISVAPNNANKVLFSDFGFVHKTSDGGATWQQAYVNNTDEHTAGSPTPQDQYYHSIGIENTTSWQVHWQDANNMFSCFSDINGIRSINGGFSWSFDYTGHNVNTMYRIAKHATGNTMFAATSGVHDMYQSTRLQDGILDAFDAGGKIIYSSTNGASWQLLHQFNHPVFWLATDPNNANRMYASVIHSGAEGGIWRTNDLNNLGSSVWTRLSSPPRTEGHPASIVVLNDGKMVCTYSGRRTGAGSFTASSGVFLYDPVADAWSDVSNAGMHYWTKDIVIDPSDPLQNTWYVAVFSGWGGAPNGLGGLYKSINRGSTWTKLTGSQFDRVTSISFNPLQLNQSYLTTETQGLWISNNMNAATPTWTLVSSYPFRQPERVFFNPFNGNEIWVTSFGNGLKVGQQSAVLPIRLISFSGSRENNLVKLKWLTADEERGDRFEIERSDDGQNFEKLNVRMSQGSGGNEYAFTENTTLGRAYYRIKVVSISRQSFFSHIIVLGNNDELSGIKLLKNPVSSMLSLEASAQMGGKLQLTLIDIAGKTLFKHELEISTGINQHYILLPPGLSNGNYMLQVSGPGINKSLRVMLVK